MVIKSNQNNADGDVNPGHPLEAEHGDQWDQVQKPGRPTRGGYGQMYMDNVYMWTHVRPSVKPTHKR